MGDWDTALMYYQDALNILHDLDDPEIELLTLMNVCFLQYAQGGQPTEDLDRAQQLAEKLGQDDPLTRIYWMRGDTAFGAGSDLPQAFHYYALACVHASRASGDLLEQTLGYIDEHVRILRDRRQSLAAIAFYDHLLEVGRAHSLGQAFLDAIQTKRATLLSPPLLG